MARSLPKEVEVLVIGNGPSALILSYILHGNVPVYDVDHPHPDPILHEKLKETTDLLHLHVDDLTNHFAGSRFPYSTQALPINVLLDTLIRPHGETEDDYTCVRWVKDPTKAVDHVVVGDTASAGGQWVDNPVHASWDIATLSYARMLSLPGYSFEEHYQARYGKRLPFASRPTRRQVADYFIEYPSQVGISDSIFNSTHVSSISRTAHGFYVHSHHFQCRHLVIASGIFNNLIPPRQLLTPLAKLPSAPNIVTEHPLLVIGSGFSAADVIVSAPPTQRIIQIFKWDPMNHPSPLRGCHQHAYPEYAGVYKRMKIAAVSLKKSPDKRPKISRTSSSFDRSRDWASHYEGLPNTEITAVDAKEGCALVTLRNHRGEAFDRQVGGFAYVVGRRGRVDFFGPDMRAELGLDKEQLISGQTFRHAAYEDLEVVSSVFVVGSLTGDSLIRFAYGGCAAVAGKLLRRLPLHGQDIARVGVRLPAGAGCAAESQRPMMNGFDGHLVPACRVNEPLDRRKE